MRRRSIIPLVSIVSGMGDSSCVFAQNHTLSPNGGKTIVDDAEMRYNGMEREAPICVVDSLFRL